MTALRLVLADTQTVFAQVLASRLAAEADVSVRVAVDRNELLLALVAEPADVLLIAIELDDAAGLELATLVCERWPQTRVVVLAPEADPHAAASALLSGVAGWVTKEVPFARLLEVLHGVRSGQTWLSSEFLTRVLRALRTEMTERSAASSRLHELSARERQVLVCMSQGMRRSEIAEQLFVSKNTVRSHQQNVLAKLGVHSALEAAALARRAGLVDAPSGTSGAREVLPPHDFRGSSRP